MEAAHPASPTPSSPGLEGYDSALDEVITPRRSDISSRRGDIGGGGGDESESSDDSNRTIRTPQQRVSLIGANQEPVRARTASLPPRDARGRFTRRRASGRSADSAASGDSRRLRQSSGVGREIGSASDLVNSQQSLSWDNYSPPIQEDTVFDFENSSTSGLASVTLREREVDQILDDISRLQPVDERGESRASNDELLTMAGNDELQGAPPAVGDDVVARALLEIEDIAAEVEDDFTPYIGKPLIWERLQEMLTRTKELKKLLRGNDLLLKRARVAAYDNEKQAMVREAKAGLTAAMQHFDELLIQLTAERAAAGLGGGAGAGGGAAHDLGLNVSMSSEGSEVDQELLDHTRQRVISWQAEFRILLNKIEEMSNDVPTEEEKLYQVGEHLLIVTSEAKVRSRDGESIAAALHKCRAYKEEREILENIATLYSNETALRELMLTWRSEMGVWHEKSRRAVNRSNLKMPKFTGQPKSITIFEFKKEWEDYKKAAALSKQEGLAELKQAI